MTAKGAAEVVFCLKKHYNLVLLYIVCVSVSYELTAWPACSRKLCLELVYAAGRNNRPEVIICCDIDMFGILNSNARDTPVGNDCSELGVWFPSFRGYAYSFTHCKQEWLFQVILGYFCDMSYTGNGHSVAPLEEVKGEILLIPSPL